MHERNEFFIWVLLGCQPQSEIELVGVYYLLLCVIDNSYYHKILNPLPLYYLVDK